MKYGMKKGTGLPQLFGFGLIMLVSLILIVATYFFDQANAPVSPLVDEDFADFRAHYVLSGFLDLRLGAVPEELTSIIPEPTFADLLVMYDDLLVVVDDQYAFRSSVARGINASLKHHMHILSVGENRLHQYKTDTFGGAAFRQCEGTVGESSIFLPKKDEQVEVKLRICVVNS